ncbi:hypothetical protein [Deinococcus peraridilitoris]|uniref:Uncharacterized protein n=1 Tax=Deinococcus peraridilitoris (strain DSM 19664 / LMG 22246 / CIP 109416 / KR-200) TaxID=937777 RepID=L0A1P4_DEIPD|nr:hypothetical protein [Deinococcus peraridilitoris]AFZ66935.1 hypothetical protein Deipe_1392 [Deinococcus peraridilitoris DSM 19664]
MSSTSLRSGWEKRSDADILCAVALHDEQALRELHRRHAGCLLALARHQRLARPLQAVEDVFVLIQECASCHKKSSLDAHSWLIGLAARYFCTCLKEGECA